MSSMEFAQRLVAAVPETQLPYVIGILQNVLMLNVPEVEPDECDLKLLEDAKVDNDDSVDIDCFARQLGFNPDELCDGRSKQGNYLHSSN